jgi:predicted RNA binding protein YcfA (HicA-like mRNA interferase family)
VSSIPRISGRDAVKAFGKLGYAIDRQRGSHIVLRQPHLPNRRLVVPDHKELSVGTLRSLIREAGLTVDEFKNLL